MADSTYRSGNSRCVTYWELCDIHNIGWLKREESLRRMNGNAREIYASEYTGESLISL